MGTLQLALTDLTGAPFNLGPEAGSAAGRAAAVADIQSDERALSRGLSSASGLGASFAPGAATSDVTTIKRTVAAIFSTTTQPVNVTGVKHIRSLQTSFKAHTQQLSSQLKRINQRDAGRARLARIEAEIGTAIAMLALVAVFVDFYVRELRTRRENEMLLRASRIEATTDALTGLGNRRALIENLTHAVSLTERQPELMLALFDLNGFKQYNDTFGHIAGDALLARLGRRLSAATDYAGSAYRMGGDEFCLLARCTPEAAEGVIARASSALADSGPEWSIDCSYGTAWIPSEGDTAREALVIADRRMYAHKAERSSGRPVAGVGVTPVAE